MAWTSFLCFFLRRSGINHAITVENHRRKISVLSKIFTTSELGTEEKGANQAHFSYPARGYISRSWENCADDSLATFSFWKQREQSLLSFSRLPDLKGPQPQRRCLFLKSSCSQHLARVFGTGFVLFPLKSGGKGRIMHPKGSTKVCWSLVQLQQICTLWTWAVVRREGQASLLECLFHL